MSLAFAHLRASAASLPPRMAVVLHRSDVFAIAKTRHQQIYSGCIFVDGVSAPHMCKSSLFSNYLFYMIFFLLRRTGGGWIIIYSFRNVFSTATDGGGSIQKHVLLFAKRAIKPVQGRTGLILPLFPLVSFCRCCSAPAVFFLSTDTDVGGSKQKRVLLSKTCYQTCTRMYRFDNRSQKPHLHYTRGKKDFCFNRCPGVKIYSLC